MIEFRRRPTILDVAQLAGVSTGTVSNVIGNPSRVRPQTRSRVESAIAQLGFRPNQIARSLTRQRSQVVGMIVPDVGNPYFAELLVEIERRFEAAGYAVVFGNSHQSCAAQRRYLEGFQERQVDGLVIVVAPETDIAELESAGRETPLILVDRTVPGWRGDQVVGDDEEGMELVVEHLVQLGHRRIALLNGDREVSTARRRLLGFEAALARRGLHPLFTSDGGFTIDSGLAQASRLFELESPPTAICAANDLLALAAMTAAAGRGVKVPEQMSIVGYDDMSYARLVSPGLTTVRQGTDRIGMAAAELLIERLRETRSEPCSVVIRPELVVRGSTGPPSA